MSDTALILWGIALIACGLALIFAEAFIPSGGAIAALAAAVSIVGVVMLWLASSILGISGLLAVLVIGPVAFFWAMNQLPNTAFGRRIIGMKSEEEHAKEELAERERVLARRALVGLEGVALNDLNPVGEIEIEGQPHDALAEMDWIDAGTRVVVTEAAEFELRVRKA